MSRLALGLSVVFLLVAPSRLRADALINPDLGIDANTRMFPASQLAADSLGKSGILSVNAVAGAPIALSFSNIGTQGVAVLGSPLLVSTAISGGSAGEVTGVTLITGSNLSCANGTLGSIDITGAAGASLGSSQWVEVIEDYSTVIAGSQLAANMDANYWTSLTNTGVAASTMYMSTGETHTFQVAIMDADGGDGTVSSAGNVLSCTVP